MSDEPVSSPPAKNLSSIGMSCAVSAAMVLLYAADYIFLRMAKFDDVYKSIKVRTPWCYEVIYAYGWILWGVLAVFTAVSIHQAIYRPSTRRTLGINISVLACAMGLAFMARQAVWEPFMGLLQGIGTAK